MDATRKRLYKVPSRSAAKYFLVLACLFVSILVPAQNYDHNMEGNRKLNAKQYMDAELIFKAGIAKFPERREQYAGLAHALVYQKKHTEADSFLDILLEMEAKHPGGLWWKGMNFYFWKEDSMAILWFKQFIPIAKEGDANNRIVHWYITNSYFHWLKTDGLTYSLTEDLLYHGNKFITMRPDDPNNYAMEVLLEKIKAKRPEGRHDTWVYSD